MALVSMVQSFVLIIQNDRTSILFGKLECILKLSPCSTKGKVIKESNKNNVVKQTSVKTSDGPCACRLKPTKTNFKKNNTVNCGLSQLSPCVSRELGRCHLLSEMWRSGPGHLLAHCLRTTEQLSVCVLMFACVCVCHAERHTLHVSPPPTWQQLSLVQDSLLNSYYTLNIHNSFIWSNLVWQNVCGIWKCIDRVMFKKSAECHVILLLLHIASRWGCWEEKRTVIIISQGTVSELK